MRDGEDRILYIGKAKVLRNRVRSYFQSSQGHSPRISLMVRQVCDIEVIVTDSDAEALALESNLIKQNQPHFNILLKDDKKYPYLCITWSEAYPRIFITRRRRFRGPHDRFYGPYVDVGLLRRTLALVKRVFPLRQRPQPLYRDRTCLNHAIGRCPGVCQQRISSEDYHRTLRKVAMVFQGRNDELQDLLRSQMDRYAERLDFEAAARVRDQIQGLETLTADQKMSIGDGSVSRDVVALEADGRVAAVQLFQMRAGKLVGRLGYMADVGEGDHGWILQRVIEEHYSQVEPVEIPPDVLLQHPLPQQTLIQEWLSERRGLWPSCWSCPAPPGALRGMTSAISRAAMPWLPRWCSWMAFPPSSTIAATSCKAPPSAVAIPTISWRWPRSCGVAFAAGPRPRPRVPTWCGCGVRLGRCSMAMA